MLFALGRNDWFGTGSGTQSAADYQTMVGAWLDDFHAASPMTTIWAMSTTLESTAQEAATNSFGSLLSAYRTGMQTACSARSGFCNFIDGTTVPGWSQTASLADGIHPNAIGSYQIATWLGPILVPQPQNTGYWPAPNWSPPGGGGGGFIVTGTGLPWFNSGTALAAAQQFSGNVTLGAPSAGFVPATVTGAQGNVLTFGTSGTVTWAGTDSAAGFIQNATTNVTTVPIQFVPQVSTNANGNGFITQFFDSLPAGSGAQGGFEFTTLGAANSWIAPIGTGADYLFLHESSLSSTNYSVGSDGTNLLLNAPGGGTSTIQLRSGSTNLIAMFQSSAGAGSEWVLPGGVSAVGGNLAIQSDGAAITYFNAPGSLALTVNGISNPREYITPSGVVLNGATSNFGSGTGVLVLAEATAAPSLPDGVAGNSILFSEPSGLYADEPTATTSQIQWQLAPVAGGTQNGESGTFTILSNFCTSSGSGSCAQVTVPVPSSLCVSIESSQTGRPQGASNGGGLFHQDLACCGNGGTPICSAATSISAPSVGSFPASIAWALSGSNMIGTVSSSSPVGWFGYTYVNYN